MSTLILIAQKSGTFVFNQNVIFYFYFALHEQHIHKIFQWKIRYWLQVTDQEIPQYQPENSQFQKAHTPLWFEPGKISSVLGLSFIKRDKMFFIIQNLTSFEKADIQREVVLGCKILLNIGLLSIIASVIVK